MLKKECLPVGILQKPYGVKGKVIIRFNVQSSEKFQDLESVFIEIDKQPVPFFILEYTVKDNNTAVVKLEELDSEEKAKEFSGYRIMILKKDFSDSWLKQEDKLKLYRIFDTNGNFIGIVHDVIDYPTHSVFLVFKDSTEILIPVNDNLIVRVDNKKKMIIMNIPDGLLDIYL